MDLSSELIKQFAEITQPKEEEKKASTVYGTTVSYNGGIYVKIDGSDLLTPVKSTVNLGAGQRVSVVIKNHEAMVNGNLTDPSAGKDQVDKIETDVADVIDQISEFEIVIANKVSTDELIAAEARIGLLIADKASIKELEATEARIGTLIAEKASIEDLDVVKADITNLVAKDAEIENLIADKVNIGDLTAINADIKNLKAKDVDIENLVAKKATIEELEAIKASIGTLEAGEIIAVKLHANSGYIEQLQADVGRIDTLVGGNLTMDNIHSLILSSDKVTVKDAFITNAMIDSVSANKVNAGTINTNNVNIQSDDGSMILRGTLQQFKDQNGKVRIQMGKDATGNFTFALFDEAGTGTLIDSTGIKANAIGDGLIVNDMVSDDAGISGGKLDIDSVITEVNGATNTIKGSRIKLDEKNQTLDVAFNSLSTTVTDQGEIIESNTTDIELTQGQIKTLISNTTITEDGKDITIKDAYSSLKQIVDTFQSTLSGVESKLDKTIKSTKPQYYVSTSPSTTTGGTWIDDSPTWSEGKYVWQRLFFTYTDGTTDVGTAVCIQGAEGPQGDKGDKGDTGNTGKGMVSNTPQFYASTSNTSATGGSWLDTCPAYTKGKFLWVRFKMVWSNPTETTYSNEYYEPSWDAKAAADDASTTVTKKVSEFTQTLGKFEQSLSETTTTANDAYSKSSSALQKIDTFTLSFKESGGYNLLYNGSFEKNLDHWSNTGNNTIITDSSCPARQISARMQGELGETKQLYQEIKNIKYSGTLVLSYWSYVSSSGISGTTNPFLSSQLMIEYTDGTKVYPLLKLHSEYDTWERHSLIYPCPEGKRVNHVYLGIYNRDTTKIVYISDVIISKGSIIVPFAPNHNEIFDGETVISKNGVKVTQSNYNGYTNMRADGFYLNDGKEDVIKCNKDGLYVKGRVTITGGSVPDTVLSSTIQNGAKNGTSAQSTLNSKASGWDSTKSAVDSGKSNWNNAVARVTQWATGAISGSTTINGGLIETNTILARSIAIGDFTNYCPVTPDNCHLYGFTKVDSSESKNPWIKIPVQRDVSLCKSHYEEYKGNVEGTYYIEYEFSSTAKGEITKDQNDIGYLNIGVGLYAINKSGTNSWFVVSKAKSDASGTIQKISGYVTVPNTVASFGVAAQHAGWKSFSGETKIRNIKVNKMTTGNLIVDGAIDGKTIRGAELIGGEFRSTAVNEMNMPLFSVSATGEIYGAEIDCRSISAEGDMSAESLSVDYINNSRYQQCLDESIDVNIKPGAVSDTDWFDGATYASFDDMYDVLPRNLNGYTVKIYLKGDYTGNINLNRFHSGHCYVLLEKHTVRGYIYGYGPSMRYAIYGNTNSTSGGTTNFANIKPGTGKTNSNYKYAMYFEYTNVTLYDLNVYAASQTEVQNSGILVTNMAKMYASNIQAYNNPVHLFRSQVTSHIYVASSGGLTTSNTFSAISGSIQHLNKGEQAGCGTSGTNPYFTSGNAQIYRDGVTFATTGNSGGNDSGSPTTETHTVTLKATSGNTYRRTVYNSWKNDGTVRQGDYGYGDCDGFWFFGSQLSNYKSKNITKVQITIKRNSGGTSTAVSHKLVGHNYASKPSGTPAAMGSTIKTFSLAVGNSITLTLSAAEIATFKQYKGIGLKNTYSSGYYSVCSATCTVKITYTE